MRRFTLITIILLFTVILVAAIAQVRLARGPARYPGPGFTTPLPTPASTPPG